MVRRLSTILALSMERDESLDDRPGGVDVMHGSRLVSLHVLHTGSPENTSGSFTVEPDTYRANMSGSMEEQKSGDMQEWVVGRTELNGWRK